MNRKNIQYALVSLLLALISNQAVYQGTRVIQMRFLTAWDITLDIDYQFPLVPWTLIIYLGSYVIWSVSYFVIAMQDDRMQSERFFTGVMVTKLFCLLIFLAVPTTSDIRPVITGTSFFENMVRNLYAIDFPVNPTNYFPSMHCLASWSCFIGVRGKKQFPLWWQIVSFILAIAVFVSTITTRQHVILDVFGGIAFAELSHAIAGYGKVQKCYSKASAWIMHKLFRWNSLEG